MHDPLGAELGPTLATPAGNDFPPAFGCHAGTETDSALALDIRRLVRPFHVFLLPSICLMNNQKGGHPTMSSREVKSTPNVHGTERAASFSDIALRSPGTATLPTGI
jgi:hypothetical protein